MQSAIQVVSLKLSHRLLWSVVRCTQSRYKTFLLSWICGRHKAFSSFPHTKLIVFYKVLFQPHWSICSGISGIHIYPHFECPVLNGTLYLRHKQHLCFQGYLSMSQSVSSLANIFRFLLKLLTRIKKTSFLGQHCFVFLEDFLQHLAPELVFQMDQSRTVLLRWYATLRLIGMF